MNKKMSFVPTFNRLISMGVHLAATYVDRHGLLQIAEIFGGYIDDPSQKDISLSFFTSATHAPTFFTELRNSSRIALVICSPQSMETLQIKGDVDSIHEFQLEEFSIYQTWQENYFDSIKSIGIPDSILLEMNYEPTHTIKMRITDIFMQTPAPGTGEKW